MTRLFVLFALAAPVSAAPLTALAYHPSGQWLAVGGYGSVEVVDAKAPENLVRLDGLTKRVTAVAYSRDGKRFALACGEPGKSGVVKLYEADHRKLTHRGDLAGAKDIVHALDFSPDGKRLCAAGYDRVVRVYDCDTMQVAIELKDHSDTVHAAAYSPDGRLLATASADRAVKVWDAASGKRLHTLGESTDWVYTLAWHPDGKRLAAAGVDKSLRVWEVSAEAAKLSQAVFAHTEAVTRIAFTADGTSLYSISEGKAAKKWDAAKLVEQLVFPPVDDTPQSLAVRPDGKQIAIGTQSGVLTLLDAVTGKVQEPAPKPKPKAAPTPKDKQPTATTLTPNFGPRSRTTTVKVGLDGEWTAKTTVSGLTLRKTPEGTLEIAVGPTTVVGPATITFDPPAPPATFIVDRHPVVTDAAAIDSARRGRPVKLPTTVVGTLDRAGQADYYRFDAKAGEQVGAQVLTAVLGSKLEPVLEIADADGRVLAESSNGLLAFTCAAAGTYAIGVHDKDYRGGADQCYRLHVGDVPIVAAVRPIGVQRGQEAVIALVGVNLRKSQSTVMVAAEAVVGSRVPVPLDETGERPLGDASIVVGEFPEETVKGGTKVIANPGTANGVIGAPGESHLISFPAKKGERLLIDVNARRAGSPLDPMVEILDAKGKPVERVTLRCTARTFVVFRDHDSDKPGIRIETWGEFAMNDLVLLGNEVLKIAQLPLNPDADCDFYAEGGKRVGYLDTTPGYHPSGAPVYKVEVHPPGSSFPPNGLPVVSLPYRNDDGGPGYGKDSRLFFDPPADGMYTVRIADARGEAGPTHAYRLTVRPPRPDFTVSFNPTTPNVWKGGAIPVSATINRVDGFDGPVRLRLEGLSPGFEAPPTTIEAGQLSTTFALYAKPDATVSSSPIKLVATADIDGKEVVREVTGGLPKTIDPGDIVTTTLVDSVAIKPGGEAKVRVRIERRGDFKGRIPVEVRGLPHGVRVLDIGLNGILITERDTERDFVIYAEPWVKPTNHPFVVLSKREGKGTEHAARCVTLKVEK